MKRAREALERAIIGAVVLESSYLEVSCILAPPNFGSPSRSVIWGCISDLHPMPYDLVSLNVELSHRGHDLTRALVDCTSTVSFGGALRHHAMLLLEMDIRAKAVAVLDGLRAGLGTRDPEKAAHLNHMSAHMGDHGNDVLRAMVHIGRFLSSVGMEDELEAFGPLIAAVPVRAAGIKRQSQVRQLIGCLEGLAGSDLPFENRSALKVLVDLTLRALSGRPVSGEFVNKLKDTTESL